MTIGFLFMTEVNAFHARLQGRDPPPVIRPIDVLVGSVSAEG